MKYIEMLRRSRKSQVAEAWYFTMAAIVLALIIITLVVLVARYQAKSIYVDQDMVLDIYMMRAWNNPNCFAYHDVQIKRSYPGVIDPAKFTDERLGACYDVCYAEEKVEKGSILGIGGSNEESKQEEKCLPKFGFRFRLKRMKDGSTIQAKTENFQSSSRTYSKPVLIYYASGIEKGTLEIDVQRTLSAIEFEGRKED